jgi:hypothetical protein
VFWLRRTPYLRWAGAALLVGFAVVADLRGPATESRPFAAADLKAGAPLGDSAVEWRRVPRGLLAMPELAGSILTVDVGRGEPLTPAMVDSQRLPPKGWWALELDLPEGAAPGDTARVVVAEPPLGIEAMILTVHPAGPFEAAARGLVAVAGEHADAAARAAQRGDTVVLLEAR